MTDLNGSLITTVCGGYSTARWTNGQRAEEAEHKGHTNAGQEGTTAEPGPIRYG